MVPLGAFYERQDLNLRRLDLCRPRPPPVVPCEIKILMITESRTRSIEPGVKVVAISGRLNLGNALISVESGIKRLIGEGNRKLIVDLGALDFIDSAGIGMLVICNGEMERNGGQVRIAGAHGVVADAFRIVHMSRIVPLDPDVDSAYRNLLSTTRIG